MLSLSMIVRNEEGTIERVLSCAQTFCDEMVVVDTGSTDRTVELAQRMGAKVFSFPWVDDFAAARNYSLDCCQGDWVIWLDADDVVTEANQKKILALKETTMQDPAIDAIFMLYQYYFDEKGHCIESNPRERIFRRIPEHRWHHPVHEGVYFKEGRIVYLPDITIDHHPLPSKLVQKAGRNIRILENAVRNGDESCRMLVCYAHELKAYGRHAEAAIYYRKYLDKSHPVDGERYMARLSLADCYQNMGEPAEAVRMYMDAILTDSRRAEAFNMMGRHFYALKEWARAIPFFEAARKLKKSDVWGSINDQEYGCIPPDYLAVCYERLGQYDRSIQMTLKALNDNPDRDRLIRNLHYLVDRL